MAHGQPSVGARASSASSAKRREPVAADVVVARESLPAGGQVRRAAAAPASPTRAIPGRQRHRDVGEAPGPRQVEAVEVDDLRIAAIGDTHTGVARGCASPATSPGRNAVEPADERRCVRGRVASARPPSGRATGNRRRKAPTRGGASRSSPNHASAVAVHCRARPSWPAARAWSSANARPNALFACMPWRIA